MCKKYIAYYLRLSLDDNSIGESNSITSQRELIKEYIYSSDEFVELQVLEFVDDGYSGTNFNRPGIKQLLESVKNGEIGCIIVKDFSRFGRQYLEVSKYIEQIFPYIGIRFIAINDNYDSNNHKGTTAEIDVPVRNMINEIYSKDISKKVKSTIQTKIKQGTYSNGFTVYGYKIDNSNKGQLLIDEPAAAVVRKIFQLSLDGVTLSEIANILNNERIPTPSQHKNNTVTKRNWNDITGGKIWTNNNIYNILKDERYIGTFIGGMREMEKLGSNKQIKKPKEEWVRIPNNHPAIISQEQFDTVRGMVKKCSNKDNIKKNSHRPLYKKVWCGKCGHRLSYRNPDINNPLYFCKTIKYTDEYGCMRGTINEKSLSDAVINTLLMQIKLFIDSEKLLRMAKNKANKPDISKENYILQLDNEIKALQSDKRKLYERFKREEINQTLYLQERETLEKESTIKTTEYETLVSQKQSHDNILESTQKTTQKFLKYQSITELTKELADEFIESVHVYDSDQITVKFTVQDEIENIMRMIQLKN